MPDGTHKIIGGAGGKLSHLRLKNVKSPAEYAASAAEKGKKKRAETRDQRRARFAAMTDEERSSALDQERHARKEKQALQVEKVKAERRFIETVRTNAGGVDTDLDEAGLRELPEHVADRRRNEHHRKQLRQAIARKDEVFTRHTEDATDAQVARAAYRDEDEADDTIDAVNKLVVEDLALGEEEKADRAARRAEKGNVPGSRAAVSEAAIETAAATLDTLDLAPLDEVLAPPEGAPEEVTASRTMAQRAAKTKREALVLHHVAEGRADLFSEEERAAAEKSLGEAASPEEARREAALKLRRAEVQEAQAKDLARVEVDDPEAARRILEARDARAKVTGDLQTARKLGLAGETPVQEVEQAAIEAIAKDAALLRSTKKQLALLTKDIERGDYDKTRRAFDLAVEGPEPVDVDKAHDAVLTELTRRLEGVAMPRRTAFQQAIGAGHYNALADVALGMGKQALLDRTTVDALGLKNASTLMRYALEKHAGVDAKAALAALESHHVAELERRSTEALAAADAIVPDLVATAQDAGDIEAALTMLDAHEGQVDRAAATVGSAIGALEGTATLSQAYRETVPDALTMKIEGSHEQTLTWLHAVGLRPGDYTVDIKSKQVTIPQTSWDRMIRPDHPDEVKLREDVDAIKAGKADEEDWLPAGMVARAASTFTRPAPEAPRNWAPLKLGADTAASVKDHIASRLADGEPASAIRADMMSPQMLDRVPQDQHDRYLGAIDELFPRWERGKASPLPTPEQIGNTGNPAAHLDTLEEHVAAAANGHPDADPAKIRESLQHLIDVHGDTPSGEGATIGARAKQALRALNEKRRGEAVVPEWARRRSPDYWQDSHADLVTDYLARAHPNDTPVHAQALDIDDKGVQDAVYRSLAELPEAKYGYQPIAQLDHTGRRYLRDRFYAMLGIKDDKDWVKQHEKDRAEATWKPVDAATSAPGRPLSEEPPQYIESGGLFGGNEKQLNPDWQRWSHAAATVGDRHPKLAHDLAVKALGERPESKPSPAITPEIEDSIVAAYRKNEGDMRGAIQAATGARPTPDMILHMEGALWDRKRAAVDSRKANARTPWESYVQRMGGQEQALEALQHHVRGEFTDRLVDHYGKVTGQPLKTTTTNMPNMHQWVRSTSSLDDLKAYQRELAELDAGARERESTGRFREMGENAITADREARAEQRAGYQQDQGGLFGASLFGAPPPTDETIGPSNAPALQGPAAGQRKTPGARVEAQLESVIGRFAHQFDPKRRNSLWGGFGMSGDRVEQQRVIKAFGKAKRMGGFLGTGSGKSAISIGAFTEAHAAGEAKKGLFAVPAAVQAQFAGEMQQFTEPGKYRWQTGEGLSHHERLEAMRNPDVHMTVMTHQAIRDTVVRAMADHYGKDAETLGQDFLRLDDKSRASWVKGALKANGIDPGFLYIDEAHQVTARVEGEGESMLSAVMHALAHPDNATHLLAGTATPHKNDTAEMLSMARLVRPDRYADRGRFMANWGQATALNPDALRREMGSFTYSHKIPPHGVNRIDGSNPTVRDGKVALDDTPIPLHPEQQAAVSKIDKAYAAASRAAQRGGVDVEAVKVLSPRQFVGKPDGEHERIARMLAPSLAMMRDNQHRRAVNLAPAGQNAKLDRMADVVEHEVRHATWTDTSGKVTKGKPTLIFTDRAEEANHIRSALAARGLRVGLYHGAMSSEERERARKSFEPGRGKESEATTDVLILTPSGEAGLNLQRAKAIHHYDVPQTEKSHAQRTGRAYRQGQTGDVDVYNWHTDTQMDGRGLDRLRDKRALASVFETPLGNLDERGIAMQYRKALAFQHAGYDPDHPDALAAK